MRSTTNTDCFCKARETVLREIASAGVYVETDDDLGEEIAKAAMAVVLLVSEGASTELLVSPRDGLPLYHCLSHTTLALVWSLSQYSQLAVFPAKPSVYCCSELYLSGTCEMKVR